MNASPAHLFLATPCYGGLVHQRYMHSCLDLILRGPALGIAVSIEMLGYESLITRGRNALVSRFLDRPETTHLLFVDSDIAFGSEQVLRMLALDVDVAAGMYPLKTVDWSVDALVRAEQGEPLDTVPLRYVGVPCPEDERETREGFCTAEYAGTGFMMIRRNVFERMIAAFPDTRYTAAHTERVPSSSPNQYALFDCMIDTETGHYLSEDYAFCKRWRGIGGKIWLDTQGALAHIGVHEFNGRPALRHPIR